MRMVAPVLFGGLWLGPPDASLVLSPFLSPLIHFLILSHLITIMLRDQLDLDNCVSSWNHHFWSIWIFIQSYLVVKWGLPLMESIPHDFDWVNLSHRWSLDPLLQPLLTQSSAKSVSCCSQTWHCRCNGRKVFSKLCCFHRGTSQVKLQLEHISSVGHVWRCALSVWRVIFEELCWFYLATLAASVYLVTECSSTSLMWVSTHSAAACSNSATRRLHWASHWQSRSLLNLLMRSYRLTRNIFGNPIV